MSDLAASPQTQPPAQPAAPRAFDAGDIDIEMLLDQAQALVDDATDQFSDPPQTRDSKAVEPAALNVDPEPADTLLPPAAEPPALAEHAPEVAPVAVAHADLAPSPTILAESGVQSQSPEEFNRAAPPPANPPSSPTEAASAETAPAQPNDIVVEDFGMPTGTGPEPAALASAASPGPATAIPEESSSAPAPVKGPPRIAVRPLRIVAACILLLDRPFARISENARRRVGWIAIATFLMGTVAWLLPVFRGSLSIHK